MLKSKSMKKINPEKVYVIKSKSSSYWVEIGRRIQPNMNVVSKGFKTETEAIDEKHVLEYRDQIKRMKKYQ